MSSSTKAKCTTLSLVRLIVVILFFIVCFCIPFYKDGKAESFLEFIMQFPLGFALICIEEALHNLKSGYSVISIIVLIFSVLAFIFAVLALVKNIIFFIKIKKGKDIDEIKEASKHSRLLLATIFIYVHFALFAFYEGVFYKSWILRGVKPIIIFTVFVPLILSIVENIIRKKIFKAINKDLKEQNEKVVE